MSDLLGLDFGVGRVEAEVAYQRNDIDKIEESGSEERIDGNLQVVSYMVNGHLNVPLNVPVKPYITAGVGFATADRSELKQKVVKVGDAVKSTKFAYQAGIGVCYDLTTHITLDGSYRYLVADFDFTGSSFEYGSHNILLGVRYNF
ncbi:MAG: hypothetical protein FD174_4108 [Geobacteraceae bacterium]|nr:MAG: hypothetical protein FD174_4108 [Geobacteraceae bacterium]